MFEPVHGSAPDIAFQDKANPIAMILSVAMAFQHSLNQIEIAKKIEKAVLNVIEKDYATGDFYNTKNSNATLVGTNKMGDLINSELKALLS